LWATCLRDRPIRAKQIIKREDSFCSGEKLLFNNLTSVTCRQILLQTSKQFINMFHLVKCRPRRPIKLSDILYITVVGINAQYCLVWWRQYLFITILFIRCLFHPWLCISSERRQLEIYYDSNTLLVCKQIILGSLWQRSYGFLSVIQITNLNNFNIWCLSIYVLIVVFILFKVWLKLLYFFIITWYGSFVYNHKCSKMANL